MSSQLAVRRGSQTPRVCSFPDAVATDGPDVVELAAGAGLQLDEWQQLVMRHALGLRPGGRWAAPEVGVFVPRQNGKGALIEARVLAGLFLFGEKLILWSAHEYKTAQEGFLRMKHLIEANPAYEAQVAHVWRGAGEQGIELHNGCRLRFVARSRVSGRGFSGDTVILDEAQELTELQMKAMQPTLSARPNWQIWYLGTPPDDPDAWICGIKQQGESAESGRLAWFDWGIDLDPTASDYMDRLADRDLWYQANPALGIRIEEETVETELRRLKAGFGAERLGVWPTTGAGKLISPAQWAAVADPDSTREDPIALAVDIAPLRDAASIAVYGPRPDGLGHVRVVDYRPGTDWLVGRIVELHAAFRPVAVGMGRGTYASIGVELAKAGITVPADASAPLTGELAVTTATEMAAACGQFIDAVRDKTIRHIPSEPLDVAVSGAKTRKVGDTIAWARQNDQADISPLVAATLARWAYEARQHLINTGVYDTAQSVF